MCVCINVYVTLREDHMLVCPFATSKKRLTRSTKPDNTLALTSKGKVSVSCSD